MIHIYEKTHWKNFQETNYNPIENFRTEIVIGCLKARQIRPLYMAVIVGYGYSWILERTTPGGAL